MDAPCPTSGPAGFTLIEVLAALGLCALLATATASAVAFAARTEQLAAHDGAASLLLPTLYASQRLRPDELPTAPCGWRVARDADIVQVADELLQEWHRLAVQSDGNETRPVTLLILDDAP